MSARPYSEETANRMQDGMNQLGARNNVVRRYRLTLSNLR